MSALTGVIKKVPLAREAYARLRNWQKYRHDEGRRYFRNFTDYRRALDQKARGTMVIETFDGLEITIRRNKWDARIVREIFVDRPYVKHVTLPDAPVVVDIGGYIGDFSLYALHSLKAKRVVVYEPTAENYQILTQNMRNNGFGDRVTAVNKAVSNSPEIVLNVQVKDDAEIHASAYWYQDAAQRRIPAVTLQELMDAHDLTRVDLLKVDCEGGEYDILPSASDALLARVQNIVFEFHRFPGFEAKLEAVMTRLERAGYVMRTDGHIVTAVRPAT